MAQQSEEQAARAGILTEIVVTARRREENLQDVPITVTALSEEQLAKQDIRSATDLTKIVSGLAISGPRGVVDFPFIRGLRGVIGYFAEVPATLNGHAFYFDVGSVQVLKGPQGTLFGLSTNGGAVLTEPRRPGETFGGFASITVGNRGRRTVDGAMDVPLSDKLLLRFGGQIQKADGYIKDEITGTEFAEEDYWVWRIGLTLRPTDSVENYLVVNTYRSDAVPNTYVPYEVNEVFFDALNPTLGEALTSLVSQIRSRGYYSILGHSVEEGPVDKIKQINIVDILTWDVGENLTLKNIAGYTEFERFFRTDIDGTPFRIVDTNTLGAQPSGPTRQISEELQLQGQAFDGRLEYVFGTFHAWEKTTDERRSYTDLRDLFGVATGSLAREESKTHAAFAEGTLTLTDRWSLTAGARYTRDKKEASQSSTTVLPGGVETPAEQVDVEADWNAVSYRVGVQFQVTPGTMLYFTNSKGHFAGGFNLTAPPALRVYDPESLINYELGIKSEWEVGGLQARTNFAVYYGDHRDVQAQIVSSVPLPGGGQQLVVLTDNAATGEVKGAEFEATLVPSDSFELSLNGGWMDAKYTKYFTLDPTGTTLIDASNTPYVYVPKWKYGINATYYLPINPAIGELSLSASYTFQGEAYNTANSDPQYFDLLHEIDNLDASLNWKNVAGTDMSATLYVTNATNNHWASSQFSAYRQLGLWGLYPATPRMWGLRLRYEF